MPNHPAPQLVVTESERASLRARLRAGKTDRRLEMRARIVLAAADGTANERIAAQLGLHRMTVLLWRGRFERDRLAGLTDAPRPGRRPTYDRVARDRVIATTLEPPPVGTAHWSARAMAARTGISVTTIQRIWTEAGLKPHKTETLKFNTDPELVTRVRDLVGLYLAPPERAIVLSVAERTRIQALDDTAQMPPLKPTRVERHTHHGTRDGTTHLFAALEVATGKVATPIRGRHTAADFLGFLRQLERAYPERELHVILDNVLSHETPAVREWVARHPRVSFHFHLTPTSASWMTQIETWFGVLSRQAIRRGSFRSVKELIAMIASLTAQLGGGSPPFRWVNTADQILAGAGREPRTIGGSGN